MKPLSPGGDPKDLLPRTERDWNSPALEAPDYCIASANRLRHKGVKRHQRSSAEDRNVEEVDVPESDGGEDSSRDMAHHQRIDCSHGHDADLYNHHWKRKSERGEQFRSVTVGRGGSVRMRHG